MPTGSQDYGVNPSQANESQNMDNLELASRLNAIASSNRSGQQISSIADSILTSSSLWYADALGSYILPSTKYGQYNRSSLKVYLVANSSAYGGLEYYTAPFASRQIGLAGYYVTGGATGILLLQIQVTKSATNIKSAVQVNLATGELDLYNAAGTWDNLGTFKLPTASGMPLVIKFTVNMDTIKYGKLFFGSEVAIDVSGHTPNTMGSAGPDNAIVDSRLMNNASVINSIYINDCIITINEAV